MSTPQKPGWIDVPGKGRRYWTGSEYRFYGPSDNPANKGQSAVSGDIAGMWNNFVSQYGRSTSDPTQVGAQRMTSAEAQAEIEKRKKAREGGVKEEKTPPTAKPPVRRGQNLPPSAAVPGTGPEGNKVGSDADTSTPGLQGPGAPKPDARVNANGLVSYGKDLSSLNKFTSAFTGGYELTDIKSAFQSNDLEGAYQNGSNTISTDESKYTLPDGATPSNVGGKYTMDGVDTALSNTGYQISDKSVPGTIGGNASDPQDGTSSKPDVAESIRTVRMERQAGRGSRRDPRNRGEDPDMFGGPEPSDASLVSPMYKNAKRNKIRSTFLDHEGNSIQAITAARAVAGVGNDSNGSDVYNVGGELVYAKAGEERKAINTLMSGNNPMAHLDVPGTADTQPDTPAASELSPSFAKETPGAQEFFKSAISKVKDKNK